MNYSGLLLGLATLLLIGLGFVWVIRAERHFGYLWWPYVMGAGILLIGLSLGMPDNWASALVGILGASIVWGSTELKEQALRAENGWYPHQPQKVLPPFSEIIERWKAPHL